MNRKLRPTKSAQQIKDKQIGHMLEEIEKDIENFKIIVSEKGKQFRDLKNILQTAKTRYRKVTEENKKLKQHITIIKQKQDQRQQQQHQQQQAYFSRQKKCKKIRQ